MLGTADYDPSQLVPGHLIADRYEIVRLLGSGAMGSVYLAKDNLLECIIAMKVLHMEFVRDADRRKRFLREVKLMHTLGHVNVVRTFEVGRDEHLSYFTMEYVDGNALDCFDMTTGAEVSVITHLATQIVEGLRAIHQAKIIHRDLKPGNILITADSTVKITDFGVAKASASSSTNHVGVIGSLPYIAPEVWQNSDITYRADFYSLGIILYELAVGARPFKDDLAVRMMWQHVNDVPTPPHQMKSSLPLCLSNLIQLLLVKDPAERLCDYDGILELLRRAPREVVGDDEMLDSEREAQDLQKLAVTDASQKIIFQNSPTNQEIRKHEEVYGGTRGLYTSGIYTDATVAVPVVDEEKYNPIPLIVVGGLTLIAVLLAALYFALAPEPVQPKKQQRLATAAIQQPKAEPTIEQRLIDFKRSNNYFGGSQLSSSGKAFGELHTLSKVLEAVALKYQVEPSSEKTQSSAGNGGRATEPSPSPAVVSSGGKQDLGIEIPPHAALKRYLVKKMIVSEVDVSAIDLGVKDLSEASKELLNVGSYKWDKVPELSESDRVFDLAADIMKVRDRIAILDNVLEYMESADSESLVERLKLQLREIKALNSSVMTQLNAQQEKYRFWVDRTYDLAEGKFFPLAAELSKTTTDVGLLDAWRNWIQSNEGWSVGGLSNGLEDLDTETRKDIYKGRLKQQVARVIESSLKTQRTNLLQFAHIVSGLQSRRAQLNTTWMVLQDLGLMSEKKLAESKLKFAAERAEAQQTLATLSQELDENTEKIIQASYSLTQLHRLPTTP